MLCLGATISNAQITINHSDMQQGFAVGSTFTSYATPYASGPISIFVGEPSNQAQTWDFTGYDFYQAGTSVGVEPSSAPMIAIFPDANAVLYETAYGEEADTIYVWTYHELQTDRLLLHGMGDETQIGYLWDPPAIQAMLPMTLGTSWEESWDSTFIMENVWIISKSDVSIDAFGSMILPSGQYQCLRLVQDHTTISHTPVGTDTAIIRNYHWYADDLTEVHVTSVLPQNFNETTIEVNAFSYTKSGGPAGIGNHYNLTVSMDQNSPNPFAVNTNISYSLSEPQFVTLQILDITGKQVAILVNDNQDCGNYNIGFSADDLSEGTYFYRLITEKNSLIKKMVVSR